MVLKVTKRLKRACENLWHKRRTMKRAARKSAPRARSRKPRQTVKFLHKPTCATCVKARKFLEDRGVQLNYRDITKDRLSAAEIEKLIGPRDHEDFLRPGSETYRENNMKEHPPSRREAIRLMAKDPELIRRPVVVAGGRVVIGYDENGMVHLT